MQRAVKLCCHCGTIYISSHAYLLKWNLKLGHWTWYSVPKMGNAANHC